MDKTINRSMTLDLAKVVREEKYIGRDIKQAKKYLNELQKRQHAINIYNGKFLLAAEAWINNYLGYVDDKVSYVLSFQLSNDLNVEKLFVNRIGNEPDENVTVNQTIYNDEEYGPKLRELHDIINVGIASEDEIEEAKNNIEITKREYWIKVCNKSFEDGMVVTYVIEEDGNETVEGTLCEDDAVNGNGNYDIRELVAIFQTWVNNYNEVLELG